ncbi:GNAT family N-acetyltransferase [Haliangium ochraceum]|uniref:GCN5-related N-acetyltransferase n=1 Tax=Haliangium ochraceum (strain DSM 14365 / JCM 11303 / SMP-2) TaxID=502025 RepID=D0LR73_HALO1|nr:GNAT family N-acetyltransferase [Haliangium ochraceum]ACY15581.1 GCN5-related N-acetyltransferase [Haliangium ochraceum DSM 14365]
MRIRAARTDELERLSDIARRAKAHWGYPAAWLALWRDELRYTEASLEQDHVLVAERDDTAIAVGSISIDESDGTLADLEGLWVDPDAIGSGAGRALFERLAAEARALGAHALRIASDPNAEGFYLRMGAARVGTMPSQPEGRVLPLLHLRL